MRYPLLLVLVPALVVLAGVVGWAGLRGGGPAPGRRAWVANTDHVRRLPRYRALRRRSRWALAAMAVSVVGLLVAVSVSAASPVDRRLEDRELAFRDIVLCLDGSGSMIPYDGEIADSFRTIVDHFDGERISLQLWSARSLTLFPLTDDYTMASQTLRDAGDLMTSGYLGSSTDGVYVSNELLDFLEPIDDPDLRSSSLAGDGLAACVLGFDHTDQERSRMILLATDNEVLGDQIYTLAQAMDFARRQGVVVTALYPGSTTDLSAEGQELRTLVGTTGGAFYDAWDPSSVDGIITDIEAQQRVEVEGSATTVETDRPGTALAWVAACLLALLGVGAWARL